MTIFALMSLGRTWWLHPFQIILKNGHLNHEESYHSTQKILSQCANLRYFVGLVVAHYHLTSKHTISHPFDNSYVCRQVYESNIHAKICIPCCKQLFTLSPGQRVRLGTFAFLSTERRSYRWRWMISTCTRGLRMVFLLLLWPMRCACMCNTR